MVERRQRSSRRTQGADWRPVILGVGQLRNNRKRRVEQALEPLELLSRAITMALHDSGQGEALCARVDTVDVVPVSSWAYDDLPGDVLRRTGVPSVASESPPGGHQPVRLVDRLAARIASGEQHVGVVAGAEAYASLRLLSEDDAPRWSARPGGHRAVMPEMMGSERMHRYGLAMPIRTYPLYENALRHALGQSYAEGQRWSAELYASYSVTAAAHDTSWHPAVRTRAEIETVHAGNRMICWPYPLLMNACLAVDQAAAVVVGSVDLARELGIDESRWVYVWGGAGSSDPDDIFDRDSFDRAPGMEAALDGTLRHTGLAITDVDVVDLYSCFPVVPKLAMLHLGIDHTNTATSVTGGLSSFGGPGSNYCTHAIATATEAIRTGGELGLVYGNGEYLTKHHALVLARDPHPEGYVGTAEPIKVSRGDAPAVVDVVTGEATLETWTVPFTRTGDSRSGIVVARTSNNDRFGAIVEADDVASLDLLTNPEIDPIGRTGHVCHVDGRNRFTFAPQAN